MYYIMVCSNGTSIKFENEKERDEYLMGDLEFEHFLISEKDIEKVKEKQKNRNESHTLEVLNNTYMIDISSKMYEWYISEDEKVYRKTKSNDKIIELKPMMDEGGRINTRYLIATRRLRADLLWLNEGKVDFD